MSAAPARPVPPSSTPTTPLDRWAASGAMILTGPADGPALGPPARLVEAIDRLAGDVVHGDPLTLLGERAALLDLARQAPATCGGSGRLVRARDGWMAISLARPGDVELLAAWLELSDPVESDDATGAATTAIWSLVDRELASRDRATLRERAALLGLPASAVGGDTAGHALLLTRGPTARPARPIDGALVVDLSSLWAGPLCGQLLAEHGADVVKVESTTRPDGARRGEHRFFDLLNGPKRSVALDLASHPGRRALAALVDRADVVIEASRPRALAQLGLRAESLLAGGWAGVWVSITGYGRTGEHATRVAFGDDAAAAGGLVSWNDDEPCFCADAVADPLSGLAAASACLDALSTPGSWLLDVSMAGVAATASGTTLTVPPGVVAAPPVARPVSSAGPVLGAHTAAVLRELGIDR